jgi:hypothetical protein
MMFIRSTIPVTVLSAFIGGVVFGLMDILARKLFSKFIADREIAALLSALSVPGWVIGAAGVS